MRGMHLQREPHTERKLVTVISGAILDVLIDLRDGSNNYGRISTFELDAASGTSLFVPQGFAHGYQTLADNTFVQYAIDGAFDPDGSVTLSPLSPILKDTWPIEVSQMSEKDRASEISREFWLGI